MATTMGAATATFNPQQFVNDADAARQHYVGREMQIHGKMGPTFDPTTSYGADFTAHPLERREAFAPNSQYKGPNAKFDATTSYTNDYTQHPMERRPQQAQQQYSRNTAPFEGSTTHKDAYKAHAIDPSAYRRGDPRAYSPKSVPFEGNTSYKADYVPHGFEPRQAAPPAEWQGNNAPFDGTTSYNAEYHPHALEPRVSPNVPRGQPRSNAPFDGNTSYKDDYKQWEIERRPPFEGGQYQPSGAKFEGSTEALDAYRAWPIDPSTYQRGQGPPPMRPYVPFDGSTTMKDAFKGWQLPSKRPALGVQMVGDRTYVLIPADAPTPAVGKQVFTTVHDNQSDMCILVLRGDAPVASRNSVLGQFDLRGLPPGPRGSARVEVSFFLDESNVLVAQAADMDAARQEQWLRQGSMMAVNHSSDVRTL